MSVQEGGRLGARWVVLELKPSPPIGSGALLSSRFALMRCKRSVIRRWSSAASSFDAVASRVLVCRPTTFTDSTKPDGESYSGFLSMEVTIRTCVAVPFDFLRE